VDRCADSSAVDLWFVHFVDYEAHGLTDGHKIWLKWWRPFTRRHFRHCFAIGYRAETDAYVLLDCLISGLQCYPITEREVDAIWTTVEITKGSIVKMWPNPSCVYRPRMFMYCVSALKHALGIRSISLTPKGLYRDLIKRGGETIMFKGEFDGRNIQQSEGTEGRSERQGAS